MDAPSSLGIPRAFHSLADPRQANHTHRFMDILTIALLGVISGAEDWVHVAEYGQCKQEWLMTFLDLQGAVVTIDAIGCQKNIAELIVRAQADYLLQVKENQPTLLAKIKTLMAEAALENYRGFVHDTCRTVDGDHGRIETRTAHVL